MGHSLLLESVRPDVVPELLQLLACGTLHTNRRKDDLYGLFDISWKTVCVQDVCFITFINDLLDNSFTRWVLRRKQHFLFDPLLKVIDFLTIYPRVVISQLYVGPCQLWCVSNHGLNSRSLTVTPCKTFTFSINYQRIWIHEKIYSKLHLPHDLPPGLAWHLT